MFGLIGRHLEHSFSKEIHQAFGNNNYQIINTNSLNETLKNPKYQGFNVTIPYKTECIKELDILDEISQKTNSVNTILKKDNLYYGYNTDYYGFLELLSYNKIDISGKNVLILGNGSVSNTVHLALNTLKAKRVVKLCRKIKDSTDDIFENAIKYKDFNIIINTTPVGMYPNNEDDLLINLDLFAHLEVVIDLIYNPLRTKLLIQAEKMQVKAINGLYMLVMQAKKAHEIFFNLELPLNLANKVYKKLKKKLFNLVFVGLPLSGKSKYAKLFEGKLKKKLCDTDERIESVINMTIYDFFQNHSESEFRMIEHEIIRQIYKRQNQIISTGGGVVKDYRNTDLLKQNGIIIFLNKDPEAIAKKVINGRPLIKSADDVLRIANERIPLYNSCSDIIIAIKRDTVYHINEIKEKINEFLDN
jgi:shikimate dehydrogenase